MSSVAARFFPPQVAAPEPPAAWPTGRSIPSASITTKSSTRPRTFNTRFPAATSSTGFGAASTGASIRVWWPGQCPAITSTDPNSLHASWHARLPIGGQPGVDLSGLTPDEEFQAGITCNGVAATPTIRLYLLPCVAIHVATGADSRARHRRQRPQPAAHCAAQSLRRSSARTTSSTRSTTRPTSTSPPSTSPTIRAL